MSRRNTRQGKARRRAERDRRQVTERERKRPRTSGQGPRAVEDQAIRAAPRPGGSGPRNSDERGSGLRSDVDRGLATVDLDEADLDTDTDLENAEPTPDELAVELDMTPEKVIEVQKYGREPISLHTPLGEDGDSEFGDLIEDSEAIQPGEAVSFTLLQEQLHSVLDTLSEREAGVVSMRFGLTDGQPKTLDEIGKVYGVTRERIRQIEFKTMSKLRHTSRSGLLRDYLD